ncbi:probable sulfate transporter 3.4 [Zingiber officinale]|uniref:probable sulfate transporter 3.4 n=1 Tax=Zingiber officinale TaxID=94328 RepID=UPI001C4BA955|nr:probable sulfate transporter 3.4 [Zingiber officinale]
MVGSLSMVESSAAASGLEDPMPLSRAAMAPPEVHRVDVPPEISAFQCLKLRLREFLFPDDSFHQFKNQPFLKSLALALQYVFPIFAWGSDYTLSLLKSDVISGITIASLAIPQGISYAKLADLPPIVGLYSSFVPPLIYSALGSSRDLAVGPVSIASLVMGSMLREEVSPNKQPALFLQLAFTATFFAGVFQSSLGLLRLGFIVDFLSKPTLTGFMGGAAVIVSLQQLKGLLGIVHFTTRMGFIPVMQSVFRHEGEWAWQTVVMGLSFLAFLLIARHISLRRQKLFWVSAAAPLTSVILSTILSFVFKAPNHGIKTIGHLQKGLNPPSANMLDFEGTYLSLTIKTGIVTGILALTEGIAVGRTFASLKNYQIDGNKEMIAIGIMNIAGSCASCYVTTGSFSRSAVNYNAGSKTAASNIVMATAVLFTMLFLMPLFYYTPNVILSAIIIAAVIGLIDVKGALRLWKLDKLDFLACMSAFFGVLLISVQMGLAIAVAVSLFKILIQVTRPNTVVLGNIPGTNTYRSVAQYREATRMPSFLILGIESPIYFTNSMYVQERILRWAREEEERITKLDENPLKCIILDMAAVTDIDTSGVEVLKELKKILNERSLELVLVNPVGQVAQKLSQSGTWELFGSDRIFVTIGEAVAASACKVNV